MLEIKTSDQMPLIDASQKFLSMILNFKKKKQLCTYFWDTLLLRYIF